MTIKANTTVTISIDGKPSAAMENITYSNPGNKIRRNVAWRECLFTVTPQTEEEAVRLNELLDVDGETSFDSKEFTQWEILDCGTKYMDVYLQHPDYPSFDVKGLIKNAESHGEDIDDYLGDEYDMHFESKKLFVEGKMHYSY